MPLDIIIGTQWGDEGKGRVVDLLSARADLVARYNGGDNAGHTVTVGETDLQTAPDPFRDHPPQHDRRDRQRGGDQPRHAAGRDQDAARDGYPRRRRAACASRTPPT